MAEMWEDEGAWGSASRVPTNQWFPVNTATGEWSLPGQPSTLASSAGMPDVTASPVWGGAPDQAPLAIGQVTGTLAPQLGPQPRLQRAALASAQGLVPEQPSTWQNIARAVGMATPGGRAILQASDQQQQQQLQQRLTLRRQQMLEEQEARQGVQEEYRTLVAISQIKNKALRNMQFERFAARAAEAGSPLPADFIEAYKKSTLAEGEGIAQAYGPLLEKAGFSPAQTRAILAGGDLETIKGLLEGGLKVKKAGQEEEEAQTLQRIQAGGTLADVSGVTVPAPAPGVTPTTTPPTPTTQPARASAPSAPTSGQQVIDQALSENSRLYNVRLPVLHGIARHESNYNAEAQGPVTKSGERAEGVMQLMPGTAKDMGVENPRDPQQNIRGGTRYFAQLLTKYGGNEALALAAYNWGPGNVDKVHGDLTKMPAETQSYVKNVLATAAGGQRGPAGTQGQVAGPGAPAAPAPVAADAAALTRLDQAIAAKQAHITQLAGLSSERANKVADNMRADLGILIQQRNRLEERVTETPRAVARARGEAQARADVEREQQAQPMLPKDRRKFLTDLRSDIRQEPTFKTYQDVRNGYQNVQIGAKSNSAQGDLAIINGMAKILDPTSAVMTGEAKNVEEAQGQLQRYFNSVQKFFEGDRLTPENRQRFLALARNLAQEKLLTAQRELRTVYEPLAKEGNIAFEQLLPLSDLKTPEGQSLLEDMNRAK